jgi:TolA-binding protein
MSALTISQLWSALAIPTLLILVSILLNHRGMDQLSHRIDRLEDRLNQLSNRVDQLAQIVHSDVQGLLSMIGDQGQRIVRLEQRQ